MLLIILLAAALATETPPPLRGHLCVADRNAALTGGTCNDVEGIALQVEPADRERFFLWTSADAKTAQIGVLAAKATKIELEPQRTELRLTIAAQPSPNWPTDTTITLKGKKDEWTWVLPAKTVRSLERLFVPTGTYVLLVEAEHHRMLVRRVTATSESVKVGDLRLLPSPIVRGTVVDAEGKGIANAAISLEDGSECALANEQGAFACELPEPKPPLRLEVIVASAPGYATREQKLPANRESIDFGRITLTKGRPLIVKIIRPDLTKARAMLYLDARERYEHSKIATREVTEREQELTFDGVGEGQYLVVVEGSGPLEKLEVPVEVKANADARATITIEPFRLEGTVRFGDEPLADGAINISPREHTWREVLPIRGGAFGGTMWQHGPVSGYVKLSGLDMGEFVSSPALGDDPSRWDVKIEKRMIAGRVFDAETKKPVQADIEVVAVTGKSKSYFGAEVGEDGKYQILANRPGTYTLTVTSPNHVPLAADVIIAAEDRTRTFDIALDAGVVQPLAIVTHAGQPLAHAQILEGVQDDGVNPRYMLSANSDGTFKVRGKPRETRILYVIPRGGSFAIVRVVLPQSGEAKPMQVVVGPPLASLRVKTVRDQQPVPAALLLRYNGEFLPGAIARFVTGEMPGTSPSGETVLSRLPAGMYEVWALAGRRDEQALMASNGTARPPERVGLSAGEAAVTVVVPARER